MLHRYEDIILNPLALSDFAIAKLMLLKHYGFDSYELIRDAANFLIKYSDKIPMDANSVTINGLVHVLEPNTEEALVARWQGAYDTVFNKIPLANFANTYYEMWALVINTYRGAIANYVSRLLHILLCEGVPYPIISVNQVAVTPETDPFINSNYLILRIIVMTGDINANQPCGTTLS